MESAGHHIDAQDYSARAGKTGRGRLDEPLPGNDEETLNRDPRGVVCTHL